ncbi:MAG: polyprenyl synthetase family protein [Actinomycetota bacterium]|nr:polyprenyl synthetase family protein [Actinomycetota bacterium]
MPTGLACVAERINGRLHALFEAESERWSSVDPELAVPYGALKQIVEAGGKRLRPAFCYFAYVGTGGDPDDEIVVDAGAALELLHAFAIIHDDIMDGSELRRGAKSVHRSFTDMHAAEKFKREPRRFGEGVAILIGDLAFVYADSLLESAPPETRRIYTELRLEVNVGQYLDLIGTARGKPTVDLAERICVYKSGKYTVERPLHIGASLAHAHPRILEQLSAFGIPLGEAFQLRDDMLGAFGDPAVIGKPVGEDLREGKPTSLVALTLERITGHERELFLDLFNRSEHDDTDLATMLGLIEASGARAMVESRIDQLVSRSLEALNAADLEAEPKQRLAELAVFVANRSL